MKNDLKVRVFSLFVILSMLLSVAGMPTSRAKAASTITFTAQELLGKPEDTSITINIIPATTIEYHYQYGTSTGSYPSQTPNYTATGGQPHEITITGLSPNTQYYYRMQYHAPGDSMSDWVNRSEHSFWTQRAQGSTFTFAVTSDNHENFNSTSQNTYGNIASEHPDFLIDLGDTFLLDSTTSQSSVNTHYLNSRQPNYFDKFDAGTPIFLAAGNHEDEEGWNLDDSFSIAVASIQARKMYYPTPQNDGFYSANTDPLSSINASTYGDQMREDYYAWTWGDALFMVIDEYQYTMHNPYGATAGEGSDDPKTCEYSNDPNCQWNWTLGAQQYQWFKQTLQNSTAKYKFIFSHNMLGGKLSVDSSSSPGYVRGGCEGAPYFEWGGKNADGTDGFADRRSATLGADAVPIRQLMMDNGVTAYFHGHDHQYVYETCDNMVYQEVPSPGMSGSGFSDYTQGDHGTYNTVKILPNAGSLLVTINPTQATVDYIASGGSNNYSYTMSPNSGGTTHVLTTAVNNLADGTVSPVAGAHTYNTGDVVSIAATANSGYHFVNWSGDTGTVANVNAASTTITMNGDYSITANFAQDTVTYSLTVNPGANGTITAPSSTTTTHNSGEVVTITASANTGYHFVNWTGNVSTVASPTAASTTITMNGNYTITANFAATTYSLTVNAGTGGTITTPASSPTSHNYGEVVTITASPNTHYHFINWSGNVDTVGNVNATSTTITMNGNYSITANFALDTHTLTVNAGANGTITAPFTSPSTHNYGEVVTITASANPGFHFVNWTGAVDTVADVNAASTTITMNEDYSVTANFAVTYYTLTVNAGANGTITDPTSSPITHNYGEVVNISASADPGYRFVYWSGNVGTVADVNAATTTITMQGDYTITANFVDDSMETYIIPLVSGWNLISFNIHPTSTVITDVLASIDGNYDLVYAWNATTGSWMKYDPGALPIANTLETLDESVGFWIQFNSSGTLTVIGSTPSTSDIALSTGWNLVGFPATTNLALPDALSAYGVSDFSLVYAYHANDTADPWKKYDTSALGYNDLLEMAPGWGYWVEVNEADTWHVSY